MSYSYGTGVHFTSGIQMQWFLGHGYAHNFRDMHHGYVCYKLFWKRK